MKILGWIAPGLASSIGGALMQKYVNKELSGKEREQNEFNAVQAGIQREYATSEREASQAFNAEQAQKQMDFQERMANTQYQRSVADMQAAGINPAMAFGGIAGASASGAMAQSTPAAGSAASGSSSPVSLSDVLQVARIKKDFELADSQIAKNYDEGTAAKAAAGLRGSEQQLVIKQINAFDPLNEANLANLWKDIERKDVQNRLDESGISLNEAKKQVEVNNAALLAIDAKTRHMLNVLNARLMTAELGMYDYKKRHIEAEINELYQRSILQSAQAGMMDQQTRNLLVEEGILLLDKEGKAFEVSKQKADRNWRIAGQVVSSVVGVAGTAAGLMTGAGVLTRALGPRNPSDIMLPNPTPFNSSYSRPGYSGYSF